jgi:Ca-activated chloride channel family protein
MNVTLLDPNWLWLVLVLAPILLVWHRRQAAVSHSKTSMHRNLRSISLVSKLPIILFVLAWSTMSFAMARPALTDVSQKQVLNSRDIIVAVDISGSMEEPISGTTPTSPTSTKQPRKLDIARDSVGTFIQLRTGDRIALLAFSDSTYYYWPLSSDHALLLRKLNLLNQTAGGTNFDGPSDSSGDIGPIQAAIDHYKQYGQSKSKVFVLVTDGESSIDPQRLAYFTKELDRMGVHLYIIGVGSDWTSGDSSGTEDLRKLVTQMRGTVITAGGAGDMQKAMAQINALEKTSVTLDTHVEYHDVYYVFVLLATGFWSLFLLFNAATRRTA